MPMPSRPFVETRADFRTDVRPTMFMDQWGEDVVASHAEKVTKPIDAAVALAQLLTSIRTGSPIDPDALDCSVLGDVIFFDASDEQADHFFSVELKPRFKGNWFPYKDELVYAAFHGGWVRRELGYTSPFRDHPVHGQRVKTWSTFKSAWEIKKRPIDFFDQDVMRLNNALATLGRSSLDELVLERPETWPNPPSNNQAYREGIQGFSLIHYPIYLGDTPLEITIEPSTLVHIPFDD